MLITHTYLSRTRGSYRYLFFLLVEDYVQEQQEFSKALHASLERFGRDLQDEAALVRPFAGDIEATRRQVLNKRWPARARRRIQTTPSLLMIDRDFDTFNPEQHPWLQIRIPLHGREAETGRALQRLAGLITSEFDEDVFRRARRIARRSQLELDGILQIRPGIFGVSLDLWELGRNVRLLFGS
ncbi:MAG: hypothetical protein OXI39_04945 [Gemmatimonadota bacterium]|uniref:hypothetical protein n=1 Tax=Candidatus Palauibacter scopulicola TaxID=3056741 RepID=UPI0023879DED|nr:hypothetical protein [Candidatus Palauibacter scopulicola]MDE2662333.1 hypothetical protein [Candidatus Palauibacter scopulicola]